MKNAPSFQERFEATAFEVIGDRARHLLPIFKDLDLNLQKSGMKVSFRAYVV